MISVAKGAVNIGRDFLEGTTDLANIIISVLEGIAIPFVYIYMVFFIFNLMTGLSVKVNLSDEVGKIEWERILPKAMMLFLILAIIDTAVNLLKGKGIMHYVLSIPELIVGVFCFCFIDYYYTKKITGGN